MTFSPTSATLCGQGMSPAFTKLLTPRRIGKSKQTKTQIDLEPALRRDRRAPLSALRVNTQLNQKHSGRNQRILDLREEWQLGWLGAPGYTASTAIGCGAVIATPHFLLACFRFIFPPSLNRKIRNQKLVNPLLLTIVNNVVRGDALTHLQ